MGLLGLIDTVAKGIYTVHKTKYIVNTISDELGIGTKRRMQKMIDSYHKTPSYYTNNYIDTLDSTHESKSKKKPTTNDFLNSEAQSTPLKKEHKTLKMSITQPVVNNQPQPTKNKEKMTPAKSLLSQLQKIRQEEDLSIDEINKNGRNLAASVTNALLSTPKSSKIWNVVKTITGKTKEEKINEVKLQFDKKKTQLFDRTMTPTEPDELWEMFEITYELSKQNTLATNEKIACKTLLSKLIASSERLFASDSQKIDILNTAKENIYISPYNLK